MKVSGCFLIVVAIAAACSSPSPKGANKFSDPVHRYIADHQDRRQADSLYPYFKYDNVAYRRDAVLAFASLQDSAAVGVLKDVLLRDADRAVRKAAALALGQTPGAGSARALNEALAQEKDREVLQEIWEAYGKVTPRWAPAVQSTDTSLAVGIAWALYRCGLRGVTDAAMNQQAIDLLANRQASARLGAAHYLARGAKDFSAQASVLSRYAAHDTSPDVRMALVRALGKINTDPVLATLEAIAKNDADYRVRVEAVNSLQAFPFQKTHVALTAALQDQQPNVAIAAAEAIRSVATPEQWQALAALARATTHWRVQANLYEAALAAGNHKELAEEIAAKARAANDPYQKAALVSALKHSVMSFGFVQQQLFEADTAVVRSAAADALVFMNHHRDFQPSMIKPFAAVYQKAVETGDAAVIGLIAGALTDSTLGYRDEIKDYSFLQHARERLSLPRDNESIQPLEAALAYFERRKEVPVKNEFNHPIDWNLVVSIPRAQRAMIKTARGSIVLQLNVEEAPGSVANFVSLAGQGYFDGKFFHRVVPNFVIQAGCNRGDGWGSEDYSIRSEFGERRYTTGSVGMASAGKDTEGTQWFITHSPTPRLDGRYTLFAEVVEGMDVVHRTEVGDRILEVKLLD